LSPIGDSIQEQTERFDFVLDGLKHRGIDPGLRHAASSYPAAYHHDSTRFDAIRVGIIAYGAMESLPSPVDGIAPVMSVRSSVLHLRTIKTGEWVHYGDSFQASHGMTIAVIPIGYGMGYTRHLSNTGAVLINGTRCPIVGVVGMDLTMIDVSSIQGITIGDSVTVLGRDGRDEITALEIAQRTGTIAYEITCRLGNALPRYLVNQERTAILAKTESAART
jgi:alanine racemase